MEMMGDRIASLRKQQGLSQEQLAEILGVSRQAVSKWESGQNMPEIRYIVAMSQLWKVTTDSILLGEENTEKEVGGRTTIVVQQPESRFQLWSILWIVLIVLGFAGLVMIVFASTEQIWSMHMDGRDYTGLMGYLLCNPQVYGLYKGCWVMIAGGCAILVGERIFVWMRGHKGDLGKKGK